MYSGHLIQGAEVLLSISVPEVFALRGVSAAIVKMVAIAVSV